MNIKKCTDYELVEAYTVYRNNKAFDEIFQRYFDSTFRFVFSRIEDRQATEDICSETFLTLMDVIKNLREDANLKSFIIGIAVNKMRQSTAKKIKLNEVFLHEDFFQEEEEGIQNNYVNRRQLRVVLSSLPEKERIVLEAKYLEGLSTQDIAAKIGTTSNNIRVIHHRALKKAADIANILLIKENEQTTSQICLNTGISEV